ncbi:MAG: hypothetical protein PVI57_09975 [Gemmatimonadota bacterium]
MSARRRGGRRVALLGLALVVVASPGLAAQEDLRARVRDAWDPGTAQQIEALAARAAERGVPSGPLLAKALEGAAKGVPAERVLQALELYGARLQGAAELLPPEPSPGELVAAADALRRGIPPEHVEALGRGPREAAPAALVVLADLVEAGVPAAEARAVLEEALRMGYGPPDLLELPARVRRLVRAGRGPSEAAAEAARGRGPGAGPPSGVGEGVGRGRGGAQGPPVPPGARGPRGRSGGRDPGGRSGGGTGG